MRSRTLSMLVVASACAEQPSIETTEQASTIITTIRVNDKSAEVMLVDGETRGRLTASKDQLANTKALDFSYATPLGGDLFELIQGAGPIPNSSLQVSHQAAELHVTTTFAVTRCVINAADGSQTCAPAPAVRFDLAWVRAPLIVIKESTRRKTKFGPVTTKFEGDFKQFSARVDGTWASYTAVANEANLLDTENTTVTREITLETP